jgi:hypothetical protein
METSAVAFQSIGFTAALILSRLRNQRRIDDDSRSDEESRRENGKAEEEARAELAVVKRRLRELAEFERIVSGNKKRSSR